MVSTTDLISYYKLDETSGDVLDAHGSNDATNVGATTGATGIINDGYDLERGDNDRITVPNTVLTSTGTTGTINMWINVETQGILQVLFDLGKANYQSFMYIHTDNKLYVSIYDNSTTFLVTSTNAYTWTDGWHMITFTSDADGNAMYIDGTAIAVTYGTGSSSSSKFFNSLSSMTSTSRALGGAWDGNSGRAFDGVIDEVGIWSDGISSSDVSDLYNSGDGLAYPFETGETVNPSAVSLSLDSNSPSYFLDMIQGPVSLSLDLKIPIIITPTPKTEYPEAVSLSLSVNSPEVLVPIIYEPSPVSLSLSIPNATFTDNLSNTSIGPGGIGTKPIAKRYPNIDGLEAGLNKTSGRKYKLKATKASLIRSSDKRGL